MDEKDEYTLPEIWQNFRLHLNHFIHNYLFVVLQVLILLCALYIGYVHGWKAKAAEVEQICNDFITERFYGGDVFCQKTGVCITPFDIHGNKTDSG